MSEFLANFHWLRPLWLWGLLPVALLTWLLWRQKAGALQWRQLIAPDLLPHLIDGDSLRPQRRHLIWLLIAWTLTCLALAGPAWEKRAAPVHLNEDGLVIILDLSPSMLAEDITPSRLIRARLKIADILRDRRDGQTALVAYAGDAHVVAPLTDDTSTITNLLVALHPELMPLSGSNTEAAVNQALELLRAGQASQGRLLLVTDGVATSARRALYEQLQSTPYSLSILGVGTDEGAPIPTRQGGFLRDRTNNVVIARLDSPQLERLARDTGGRYHTVTGDRRDLDWLLSESVGFEGIGREVERDFDQWYDRGHWLVLLLLPLALYCFRRGVVLALLCAPLLLSYPQPSHAFSWRDLWLTPDQRGQTDLSNNDPERAAREFRDPEWRGSALYEAGDYQAAAEAFAQSDSTRAHYNRGNALARAGELEEALSAYDQALAQQPDWEDALFNRHLVEQLLQQQEQEGDGESQDNQDDDGQDGDSDSSEGDNQESQGGDDSDGQQQDPNDNDSQSATDPDENGDNAGAPEQEDAASDEQEQTADQEQGEAEIPEDLSEEERQALEQWLRRVPDDPGGLLRRKFEYQHQQQHQQRLRNSWQPQTPDGEERW